jgi:putative ATP-dependent endonuclease of OLD family
LVLRLSESIESGDVEDLQTLWEYIKSRKRKLRSDLTIEEQESLDSFITAQRANNVFVLSEGDLETYLPVGYRSKGIDKLIEFLSSNFWPLLEQEARNEVELIATQIKTL